MAILNCRRSQPPSGSGKMKTWTFDFNAIASRSDFYREFARASGLEGAKVSDLDSLWETVIMVGASGILGALVGIPLGVFLRLTDKGGILQNAPANTVVGGIPVRVLKTTAADEGACP